MIEIRWHGRGGQGAVTSAEMIALAAIGGGMYAQAFPSFGPERRGAPVLAFNRISQKPIKVRSAIGYPDIVVVLDPKLLSVVDVSHGLSEQGLIILNTKKQLVDIKSEFNVKHHMAIVDATSIAHEILGLPIVNTAMLGALIKASEVIELDLLDVPIRNRFGRVGEKNVKACRRAYAETLVEEI
ncbi:MAG: 2-oxoacid:acceptor oxidoreductase family protein [Dehalococcoidia bacterium]|nr:2-oxoacid:acceptor oxidoreductase family protein [Dehalococcoidia bacterium]